MNEELALDLCSPDILLDEVVGHEQAADVAVRNVVEEPARAHGDGA